MLLDGVGKTESGAGAQLERANQLLEALQESQHRRVERVIEDVLDARVAVERQNRVVRVQHLQVATTLCDLNFFVTQGIYDQMCD